MSNQLPKTYILFGASGSGKGTQAALLYKELNEIMPTDLVQTGELVRDFVDSDALLAKESGDYIKAGKLVPTFMVTKLLADTLIQNVVDKKAMIFDGYPRNYVQAQMLDHFLKFANRPYEVINIAVPEDDLVERMLERGRGDDSEESIRARLAWYYNAEKGIHDFWQNADIPVHDIDGTMCIDDIHSSILKTLELNT